MNGGGNPSVGGGGFAASPAGTAPLYYKSAEIASGSAKNLCKKSGDVGGCALRGTGSPCRCGKLNGGLAPALPARRASAIPGGGACPVGRLPTLPLPSFLPPIPPAPFPGGEGGDFRLFHARGFAPCIPGAEPRRHWFALPLWCLQEGGELNPGGTCYSCPGGEDHLKRRRRLRRIVPSPPVPPLLGCRHCS